MPSNETNVPDGLASHGLPFKNPNPHQAEDTANMFEDSDMGKANKAIRDAANAHGGNVGTPGSYLA